MSYSTSLTSEKVKPVYIVHGAEFFFIDRFVSIIRKLVLSGPMAKMNFMNVSALDTNGESISKIVKEIPMFSSKRVVMVEDAQKLGTSDWKALETTLEDKYGDTCLIITAGKLNINRKQIKKAIKDNIVFKAEPLKERETGEFLRIILKEKKISMEPGAFAQLVSFIGPDPYSLSDAVERLALYRGYTEEIKEEDVPMVISSVRSHSIFELVDAIGMRNLKNALGLLENLLSIRQEPLMINAMLTRHMRQLLGARIHLYIRTDERKLPSILGAPPFMISKLIAQAKRFSGAELEKSIIRLCRNDVDLKSSRRTGAMLLEETVMDLC